MNIRQEVESAVTLFAKAQPTEVRVAYEGVAFNKPTDTPWIEIVFLASSTMNPTIDGSRIRKTGAFQINCYVPNGRGVKALEELSDAVVSLFPFDQKELYQTFSVEQTPNSSAIMIDAAFLWCAVRVKYRQEM